MSMGMGRSMGMGTGRGGEKGTEGWEWSRRVQNDHLTPEMGMVMVMGDEEGKAKRDDGAGEGRFLYPIPAPAFFLFLDDLQASAFSIETCPVGGIVTAWNYEDQAILGIPGRHGPR